METENKGREDGEEGGEKEEGRRRENKGREEGRGREEEGRVRAPAKGVSRLQ